MKELIIFGAGGHAKVVADLAIQTGYKIRGFLDDHPTAPSCLDYPILGCIEDCLNFPKADFALGIGNNAVRKRIMEQFHLNFPILIHPRATVSPFSTVGAGTVVMAGAVINPCSEIGQGCIINTCASVDHDCCIGDYVHISVGAHVAGTVTIRDDAWIGAGATISNNIKIANKCMIGAGAVVITDIRELGTYVGVPAKKLKSSN